MFLPWIGLFEQVKLSKIFVHYDDVQFPLGRSFLNRVQIKGQERSIWLTAPVDSSRSGREINRTIMMPGDWRRKHLETIRHIYSRSPFFDVMYDLAIKLYSFPSDNLAEFNIHGIETVSSWLELSPKFHRSSDIGIAGQRSQRLVELCLALKCDVYITGHGAKNYLEHESFEAAGVSVQYMDYKKVPYSQQFGDFTPYVSILDAIANCGKGAADLLVSGVINWREFNDCRR